MMKQIINLNLGPVPSSKIQAPETGPQWTKAFTLVELIVVITIIAILGTIAFIAMQGYSKSSRDSVRISDMSKIRTSLELYYINSNKYPDPTEAQPVTYSGGLAWYQGIFGNSTFINVDKLDDIPRDPLTEKEYAYSVLNTKQEYEIAGIMEGDDTALNTIEQTNAADKYAKAKISGTYNGISLRVNAHDTSYILAVPSIITSIDLAVELNRTLETIIPAKELVIDGFQNLPSNYVGSSYDSNKETTNTNFTLVNDILVYEGDVANLTPTILVTNLQASYTGTTLATLVTTNELFQIDVLDPAYLETIDSFGVSFINENLGGSVETRIYLTCDSIPHNTTKSFYSTGSVLFSTSCDTVKQDFVCIDGAWTDSITSKLIADYPYDVCTEEGALNCTADTNYIVNTHIYSVPQLNHDISQLVTSLVLENNGTFQYSINTSCYNSILSNDTETGPILQSCNTGYYNNSGTTCEQQWTGDIATGYLFKDLSGIVQYPLSCSDLLTQTTWKNTLVGSPWNGINFNNGVYYIKPTSDPAFKVYCDMNTDGGGWTMIIAQYENDPVSNWNEGIQGDYDPTLTTTKGFTLNTSQIPTHNQIAFGKDLNPTFVDYINAEYKIGNIEKTLTKSPKTNLEYHIHRDSGYCYSNHDPEHTTKSTLAVWQNTLTIDETGGIKYSWAYSPNQSDLTYRGYSLYGAHTTTSEAYAWTIWVRNTSGTFLIGKDGGFMWNNGTYGTSCSNYLNDVNYDNEGDGIYWIDLGATPFKVNCDMINGGFTKLDTYFATETNRLDWANFLKNTGYGTRNFDVNTCLECGTFPQYLQDRLATNQSYCKYRYYRDYGVDIGISAFNTSYTGVNQHIGRDGLYLSSQIGGYQVRSESELDYTVYEEILCETVCSDGQYLDGTCKNFPTVTGLGTNASPYIYSEIPTSCMDVIENPKYEFAKNNTGFNDGVYTINPGTGNINVYCDMTTDYGGWTLVGTNATNITGLETTENYGTPILGILGQGDWKYSDNLINSIKGGTEGTINGYRLTYNKTASMGTFYGKRYFFPRSCTFAGVGLTTDGDPDCRNWSVSIPNVATYTGTNPGASRIGLQRRINGRGNNGWLYMNKFYCVEDATLDGESQTGACDGLFGRIYDIVTYMRVR